MANFALKMKLIIWKNMIIRKRRWIFTTFEIVLPVLLYVILVSLNLLIPSFEKRFINATEYYPIENYQYTYTQLFYAPNTTQVLRIIDKVNAMQVYPCTETMNCEYRGFESEGSMLNYISQNSEGHQFYNLIAVIFNNIPKDKLPDKLDYRIRAKSPYFNINRLYSTSPPFQAYENNYYFSSYFMALQQDIDTAFINLQNPELNFTITKQKMPDPPHWASFSLSIIFSQTMPICSVFAFMLVFVGIIQRVMEEKASGIKELMKMMGLKSWMLWFGWYIHSMFAIIISITVITILLKVQMSDYSSALVEYSDGFLLWIFLFLYCTSGVCFCFMVSTFLKKPRLGSSLGTVIWTLTIVPVMIVGNNDDTKSLNFVRNLILLFPNTCLSYGFKTMYEFENKEVGMQWSNLYSVPNYYVPLHSMGKILFMLILDSLIFLIITWYIDNVNPGDYGIARSWKFPFEKGYWCPKVSSKTAEEDFTDSRDEIEGVSPNLQAGIQIRNLHKDFNKKKAVNGLSLDIYSNQITVLLGHNGAGKTTTMNIVTGMISPTSGSVLVDGYNIQINMDKVRESLGLCPQHNVQFPDLTVLEHLMFFAMVKQQNILEFTRKVPSRSFKTGRLELKGMQNNEAKRDSLEYLSTLCMSAKADTKASTLSGGMRRRLSLGMALVGHTKVLMLDEPTSGMDPEARREIWDLLLSLRGERTILITTHYMEEADILGDRIAIMHSGQLMCYGTSLFLKKHYGTGYTLSILLSRELDINIITTTINSFVPNATVKSTSIGSVKYELPTNDTDALSRLFLDLERNKDHLGITSFGVSITTMDDVFLKVGKLADEVDKGYNSTSSDVNSETLLLHGHSINSIEKQYNTGFNLFLQQNWALLLKRVQYTRRKLFVFIVAILIPVAFEVLTLFSNQPGSASSKTESREVNLGMYSNAQSFYSFDKENEELASYYAKVVRAQQSIATNTDQVSDAIVQVAEQNLDQYHSTLITAAEFNFTEGNMILNAMYGSFPIHSPTISLNLITNALIKYAMKNDKYSIKVTNNPLPDGYNFNNGFQESGMVWMMLYPMGLTLFISLLLGFHTGERLSGVKHLQIMTGVSRIVYWLNNYLFDMLCYLIVITISIIILAIFDDSLSASSALQAFTTVMILFGMATFPFTYFFHYRPTAGSVITLSIWAKIIFGTILPIVIMVWEQVPDEKKQAREALTYIFMLCPHFAVSYGFQKLSERAGEIYNWDGMTEQKKISYCKDYSIYDCCRPESQECKDFYNYYAGKKSILTPVLFLLCETFLYFFVFLLIDYGLWTKYFDKFKDSFRKEKIEDNNLDSDVVEEKRRVTVQLNNSNQRPSNLNSKNSVDTYYENIGLYEHTDKGSDVLLVSNLRKWFGKWFGNFYAVRGLNFGVKQSECFGLLGINGAGKTTTFKMLTGEIFVSTGTAKILGNSLQKNKKTYLKQIGYCPQFDAFNFQLTTRQMLTLFAHLRGIHHNEIKSEVDKWLNKFDIMKYENIGCSKLSGGNKRKLSTAMALIGEPPLIMLDEPTSGVDPVARRNLWSILAAMRKSGQAIVLTSHSMDECEALCDRLAIMVDGQMKCIGDIQYLKNKFGQGFTVMVKLRHISSVGSGDNFGSLTQLNDLKLAIENKYACTLKDEHKGMVMYHITDTNITIGEIFSFMQNLKDTKAIIEDFTVGDTSLEEVFLSFAKEKVASKDRSNGRNHNVV